MRTQWCRHALLALLLAAAGGGCTDPVYDGELVLDGLEAPVRVVRDERAMPYLHARSLEDALFAQGFVMAQDRMFQLDLIRHLAYGRLAELGGEGLLEQDKLFRTVDLAGVARRLEPRLADRARRTFEAFSRGVDAYVRTQSENYPVEYGALGLVPEPWTLLDTLTVFAYINWNFSANLGEEVLSQRLVDRLGAERAAELFPVHEELGEGLHYFPPPPGRRPRPAVRVGPSVTGLGEDRLLARLAQPVTDWALGGSNAWATGSTRSAGGRPILAADPHGSGNMMPVPFYPQALLLPDVRIVGIAVIGLPGVLSGRNDWMAWGFTNDNADHQDLFIETLHPQNGELYLEDGQFVPFARRTERLRVRQDDGTLREEELVVRSTPRGPVVTELLPGVRSALTFRWYSAELLDGELGLDEMMLARTPAEWLAALAKWPGITQNGHAAHRDGWLGWHIMGHVPVRRGHAGLYPLPAELADTVWDGSSTIPFDEMPHLHAPAQDWTGSANHWGYGDDYPYLFATSNGGPYRVLRLKEVLDAAAPMSVADHRALQLDTISVLARRVRPVLLAALRAEPDAELARAADLLEGWDGRAEVDSAGASLWNSIYRQMLLQTFEDELGQDLTHAYVAQAYYMQERFERLLAEPQNVWFDDVRTAAVREDRDALVRRAARDALAELGARLGPDPAGWRWGLLHQIFFENPVATTEPARSLLGAGPYEFSGDGETLQRGAWSPAVPFAVTVNAAMRMVADLGDDCKVLGSITTGVSGRPGTDHYKDQVEAYLSGAGAEWWFCPDEIERHKQHELLLLPAGAQVPAQGWLACLAAAAAGLLLYGRGRKAAAQRPD